jgi:hypothetical protein
MYIETVDSSRLSTRLHRINENDSGPRRLLRQR